MNDAPRRAPPEAADAADIALGQRVLFLRLARKLPRSALAKAVGVSPQQIEKYEIGLTRLSIGRLLKIADCLDTPAAALLMDLRPGPKDDRAAAEGPAFADACIAFGAVARIKHPKLRSGVMAVLESIIDMGGRDGS